MATDTRHQGGLILERQAKEEIVITTPAGEEILVRVARINRRAAFLYILAPARVTIDRAEIHHEKQEARRRRAAMAPGV